MRFRNIGYFSRDALTGAWRNGWMTLASVTVVIMTLLIFGAFIAINLNIQHLTTEIQEQVEIVVEVSEELDDDVAAIDQLRQRIVGIDGISQLSFIDKETALERMREQLGDIVDALDGRNPLLNTFEVRVTNPGEIKRIATAIGRLPGVESVNYGEEVVETLFAVTRYIQVFGYAIIGALGLMGLFLIANTIKLTVYARRRQINIMKFVGATDWFIRWPFILEGVFLGLIGAGIAYATLYYGYSYLYSQASVFMYEYMLSLSLVAPRVVGIELLKALFAFGICIGALGSGISVRKFLRV